MLLRSSSVASVLNESVPTVTSLAVSSAVSLWILQLGSASERARSCSSVIPIPRIESIKSV